MTFEDRINLAFAVPLGLIVGLVGAALFQNYDALGGRFTLIIVGGALLLFGFAVLTDRLGDKLFAIGVKKSGKRPAEDKPTKSPLPRVVFATSVLAGLGASLIWDPVTILSSLTETLG